MPFTRPTLAELREDAFRSFEAEMPDVALLRQSNVGVVAAVLAGAMHLQYGYLDWIARQVMADTAETAFLERWAVMFGLSRKPATFAGGQIVVTGVTGTVVPSGTRLDRADGQSVATQAEAVLASGTATIEVQALESGPGGNADAGTSYALASAIVGLDAAATVAAGGLTGGTAAEADDSLRVRLLARIQAPPHGGSRADYLSWALSVPGVTRAWVLPGHLGDGTVGVAIACDDAEGGPAPDSETLDAAQDYIDRERPVTADVTVFAPDLLTVNITIAGLSPDNAATRAAVSAELAALFRRSGDLGGVFYRSWIWESVSLASGVTSHAITVPAVDVEPEDNELPVLGAITYA